LCTIETMRVLSMLPPFVRRTLTAGCGGVLLVGLGWKALGGGDAGSTLMAFPLLSIGTTLVLVALGAGAVAIARVHRGERLSPLPADAPLRLPLPRAIARRRR
jgi:hypothetical protein